MKYPYYGVVSNFFGGIFYGPHDEGGFDTLEEAKARFDSIELDEQHAGVYVYEMHEYSAKTLFSKERELKQPTPETMGRAKYVPKGRFKKVKGENTNAEN